MKHTQDKSPAPERALLALGALDGRLCGHPLAPAWACRRRLAAAVQACGLDGISVDQERLARLVVGLPLQRYNDFGDEAAAQSVYEAVADPVATGSFEALHGHMDGRGVDVAVRATSAALAGGLRRSLAHAAFPHMLHHDGATAAILTGVSPLGKKADGYGPLHDSAIKGRRDLDSLTLNWTRWVRLLGRRRSTSRHLEVLAAAVSMTAVSPTPISRKRWQTSFWPTNSHTRPAAPLGNSVSRMRCGRNGSRLGVIGGETR